MGRQKTLSSRLCLLISQHKAEREGRSNPLLSRSLFIFHFTALAFFNELIAAYRASDFQFSPSFGYPQRVFAFRTAKVSVGFVLRRLDPPFEGAAQCIPKTEKCLIFPVPRRRVTRKHPEKTPYQKPQRKPGQKRQPRNLRCYIQNYIYNQNGNGKLVTSVTPIHPFLQSHLKLSPNTHCDTS